MNCASCGAEIQRGFAFCPDCGMKQPRQCAGCGYLCAPEFAFCPKCGAPVGGARSSAAAGSRDASGLAAAGSAPSRGVLVERAIPPAHADEATRADRRTVTVLFADLSGFTAISERLDPEIVQALQNEIFEEMTAAVKSFGGFVDKFIGDAMLSLFGAPAAHEDDPERALRAALDMIDRVARASERQALVRAPLKLHVGVNTGPVVAGAIGAGSAKSYSVTGDTVNTAQRLQSMAAPGEVLVGPSTSALTQHAFRFESLGEASIRGRAGSLMVHRLVGPLEVPRPARGLETLGLSAPLIGRDADLARMIDHLDLAHGGATQLLRLVGEAGIGKTRLVNEFLARVSEEERFAAVAVRRVACSPLGEQSYGALGGLLRAAYGIEFNASAAETEAKLAKALTELGLSTEEIQALTPFYLHVLGLGGANSPLQHVEPAQLRRQIFFAVRTLFERRLALSPLLIVVEDLHWADAVSLEALRFLLDRLERARLMLVVAHRPMAELDQFGSSRVSQTALRLTALDDAQGRTLLASYFGKECVRASKNLCRRILERSSGNPLFIEEILRSLIEMGVLRREGPHWRVVADEASIDIPAGIHALLLARMDRLPREVRALAQEAAVIGPRFDVALL
jgi:adenylate cyclase